MVALQSSSACSYSDFSSSRILSDFAESRRWWPCSPPQLAHTPTSHHRGSCQTLLNSVDGGLAVFLSLLILRLLIIADLVRLCTGGLALFKLLLKLGNLLFKLRLQLCLGLD